MKITAEDLLKFGVVDRVIYEPGGGAHRDPTETMNRIGAALAAELDQLSHLEAGALRAQRRERFLRMGR
jgi:acetyl-CoA carboxylase carboxyl transferase subunit alpha